MTAPKVASAFADKNQKFEVLGGSMGKTGLDPAKVKAREAEIKSGAFTVPVDDSEPKSS